MRFRRLVVISACCAAAHLDPARAHAQAVLQPARFDEFLDDAYYGAQADPESFDVIIDVGQGQAVEQAATTGGAVPTAAVMVTTDSFESAAAFARVEFQFAVEQIAAGSVVSVPVLVTGAGDAEVDVTGSDSAIAFAGLAVTNAGETRTTACAPPENWGGADCSGDPLDVSLAVSELPGTVFTVTLEASGRGGPGASGGALSASASVDAIVAIDPAFPRRDEFRLVFSEGLIPAPEPGADVGAIAAITAIAVIADGSRACRRRAA